MEIDLVHHGDYCHTLTGWTVAPEAKRHLQRIHRLQQLLDQQYQEKYSLKLEVS